MVWEGFMVILQGRGLPSGWVIDVWNCHGVVKPKEFAGYGNQSDTILKELENMTGKKYIWFDTGYYTVPVQEERLSKIKEAGLEKEFAERTENVCNWIVYDRNGGAINMSGFYTVTDEELLALEKVIARITIKAIRKQSSKINGEIIAIAKGEAERIAIGNLLNAMEVDRW